MQLHHLDHLVLTAADIDRTLHFYTEALGMTAQRFAVADGSLRHALCFGASKINLHQSGQEFEPKARRSTPGSADLCFLTETALDVWIHHLQRHNIQIEEGPVPRTGATGPLLSIYLRDPDGNLVEIANPLPPSDQGA